MKGNMSCDHSFMVSFQFSTGHPASAAQAGGASICCATSGGTGTGACFLFFLAVGSHKRWGFALFVGYQL